MPVNGGVKNWIPTEVLSAADLNEYLADQTIARFDDIAARNAAYGVAGAPSLQAGLFCWVASTELLYYYDGTSWSEVGAQVDDGEITEAKLASNSVTSAKIVDGTIVNADINASAGIALSKLATSTAGNIIVYNSSGVPTAVAETGDVTIDSSGVTSIASGVIVNADISTSAGIALSKLATSTAGNIIVYNSSGVPTAVAETGDVTIDSSGVTAISSGVIVNADINASAGIDKTKISGTAITAADTGTVTSTMIADGTIVNADVNASAAIALSKLATSTSSQLASIISDETGSGALVFGTSPTITPAAGTTTNAHDGAGYMGMPQVSVTSGGRTLVATDAGKHIYVTTNNSQAIAIPANGTTAFPIGTTIVIVVGNGVTGTTVTITNDTLRLANSASTGTRSIASNGMGTLLKINTTEWILSGNGVT